MFHPSVSDEAEEAERKLLQQGRWRWAIGLSILAVIASGLLGSIVWDRILRPPRSGLRSSCTGNLNAIHGAKCTWALENNKTNSAVPTDADLFGATLYIREKPACPDGGTYTLGSVGTKPRCTVPGHTL